VLQTAAINTASAARGGRGGRDLKQCSVGRERRQRFETVQCGAGEEAEI